MPPSQTMKRSFLFIIVAYIFLRIWKRLRAKARNKEILALAAHKIANKWATQISELALLPLDNESRVLNMSVTQLREALDKNEFTSTQLVSLYIRRCAHFGRQLNASTAEFFSQALKAAKESDERRAAGVAPRLLEGIPFSVKDCFAQAGVDNTCGVASKVGVPAADDCVCIKLLLQAGAIPLVRSNVPPTLMAGETANNVFGTTLNPWNTSRTVGGSSGGEAALIAVGASPLGVGTDIGGSLRIPAHCCGIYSLKPTTRRVSTLGMGCQEAPGQITILSSPGPMGKSVNDLALVMKAWLGTQEPTLQHEDEGKNTSTETRMIHTSHTLDPYSPPAPFREDVYDNDTPLRVGVFPDNGCFETSLPCARALREVVGYLRTLPNVTVVDFHPPSLPHAKKLGAKVFLADGAQWMTKVLQGETPHPLIAGAVTMGALPHFVSDAIGWLMEQSVNTKRLGSSVRSTFGHPIRQAADMFALNYQIEQFQREFSAASSSFDVVICPTLGVPAPRHGKSGPLLPAAYTDIFNVLQWPAGHVPVTTTRAEECLYDGQPNDAISKAVDEEMKGATGMPVGIQVAAPPYHDEVVLRVMKMLEAKFPFVMSPMGLTNVNETESPLPPVPSKEKLARAPSAPAPLPIPSPAASPSSIPIPCSPPYPSDSSSCSSSSSSSSSSCAVPSSSTEPLRRASSSSLPSSDPALCSLASFEAKKCNLNEMITPTTHNSNHNLAPSDSEDLSPSVHSKLEYTNYLTPTPTPRKHGIPQPDLLATPPSTPYTPIKKHNIDILNKPHGKLPSDNLAAPPPSLTKGGGGGGGGKKKGTPSKAKKNTMNLPNITTASPTTSPTASITTTTTPIVSASAVATSNNPKTTAPTATATVANTVSATKTTTATSNTEAAKTSNNAVPPSKMISVTPPHKSRHNQNNDSTLTRQTSNKKPSSSLSPQSKYSSASKTGPPHPLPVSELGSSQESSNGISNGGSTLPMTIFITPSLTRQSSKPGNENEANSTSRIRSMSCDIPPPSHPLLNSRRSSMTKSESTSSLPPSSLPIVECPKTASLVSPHELGGMDIRNSLYDDLSPLSPCAEQSENGSSPSSERETSSHPFTPPSTSAAPSMNTAAEMNVSVPEEPVKDVSRSRATDRELRLREEEEFKMQQHELEKAEADEKKKDPIKKVISKPAEFVKLLTHPETLLDPSGRAYEIEVNGLYGRLTKGQVPADFSRLSNDDWKRLSWVIGPEELVALLQIVQKGNPVGLNLAGYLGMLPEWVNGYVAKGYKFRLLIFSGTGSAWPATWDGVKEAVRATYPDLNKVIDAHFTALQSTPWTEVERMANFNFLKVSMEGREVDLRYISYKRLLANKKNASFLDVRSFLYFEIGVKELFRGDGYTYAADGTRGAKEFLVKTVSVDQLDHAWFDIDMSV